MSQQREAIKYPMQKKKKKTLNSTQRSTQMIG
jgi:hypothetical protein